MKVDIKFDPKGKKHSIQALCNGLCQIIASLYQKFVSVTFFETFHIICVCVLVAQSCPTLCDPMDCSPPGSSVHRIFQTRILEWVAISSSRGSSQSRDQTRISCIGRSVLYPSTTWEAPNHCLPVGFLRNSAIPWQKWVVHLHLEQSRSFFFSSWKQLL